MSGWRDSSQVIGLPNGRIWQIDCGTVRVVVSRVTARDPRLWFLACYDIGLSETPLTAHDLPTAQIEALTIVMKKLEERLGHVKSQLQLARFGSSVK